MNSIFKDSQSPRSFRFYCGSELAARRIIELAKLKHRATFDYSEGYQYQLFNSQGNLNFFLGGETTFENHPAMLVSFNYAWQYISGLTS